MFKKACLTIALLGLLTGTLTQTINASPYFTQDYGNISNATLPDFTTDSFRFNRMAMKKGEPYDEKKDPALRKGTENEEMPQSSFFAIPALIIGIALVFLFFNRDK